METVYQNILEQVYRYFPQGLGWEEEAYGHSPEIKRLQQRCREAEADRGRWGQVLACLEQKLPPGQVVVDWSALHSLDRCYRLSILLENTEQRQKALVVSASIIAPYYGCYLSERELSGAAEGKTAYRNHRVSFDCSGFELVTTIVAECIGQKLALSPLPAAIAQRPVPAIALESTPEGEATVFKAIFTDHFI